MDIDSTSVSTAEWRCIKCRNIPWHYSDWLKREPSFKIQHHDSFAALEEAAALGCYLCRYLRACIIHGTKENIPKDVPCYFRLEFNDDKFLSPWYCIGKRHQAWIVLKRADGLKFPVEPLNKIKRLAPETVEADLASLIGERIIPWIDDCLHQRGRHQDCAGGTFRGEADFFLPTRLIDVGDGSQLPARLVETQDLLLTRPKPEYLALSYCWGQSNEPAKTTRAILQQRKKRLETWYLPKTIQDAIGLTRRMGVRYLWVDAICIIQADAEDPYFEDWEKEAFKMASYYAHARCLISALGASDSSQGIFTERLAQKYPQRNSPIAFDDARNQVLYVPVDDITFHIEFSSQPLLARGWCFQERILSPRALHWSTNCLYWQCQSMTQASEVDPEDTIPRPMPIMARDEPHIFRQDAEFALTRSWVRVAYTFLPTRFTYPTDRLLAIQSLGSRLAEIHGVDYFAGVFGSQLTKGLLWRLRFGSVDFEKLPFFPSWSWASCSTNSGSIPDFEETFSPGRSLIRQDGRGRVFPPTGSAVDFSTPEKRSLRLEAPLVEVSPEVVRPEYSALLDLHSTKFKDESLQVEVEMTFDAPGLVPEKFGPTEVLLLSSREHQSEVVVAGIIVRPQEQYYERAGYVLLTMPLESTSGSAKLADLTAKLEQNRRHVILI
ncbi:hypothetical protein N8I77_012174 [Diaporthe amygdali]|uniref:Heterokaryon incompatibility domain-containing protein n=1 Tax=Phomopsis amygdali TaxID=1214568 RepID=A0AAD9S776_PHOAM|nr:hypothetical protein N8I77_012174 [Diaporthe amygdali]